jgi:HEPN domain-containing protein
MSRGGNKTDSRRYYDWFYRCELDLMAAKILVSDSRLSDTAVFHSVQATEKAFKAYLLYSTKRLYDGHNLVWLCKQCTLLNDFFRQFIPVMAGLNRYYIETRYPADVPEVMSYAQTQAILDTAVKIADFIREHLKFDFKSYRFPKKNIESA